MKSSATFKSTAMLMFAGLLATAVTRPACADDGLAGALDLLRTAETTMVTADYIDQPVGDVIDDLARQSDLPLVADWTFLELHGIPAHRHVTLQLRRVPLRTALSSLVIELGDDIDRPRYTAWDGLLVFTTERQLSGMTYTASYNVGDLLAALPDIESPDAPKQPVDAGDAPDEPNVSPPPPRVQPNRIPFNWPPTVDVANDEPPAIDGIVDLITSHIEPEGWRLWGGERASIDSYEHQVVITAPATMHRQVRALLRQLRREHPTGGELDVAIIDLPRAAYQRIARRFEPGSPHLGRSLRRADQARVRYRAATPLTLGEPTTLRAEDDRLEVALTLTAERSAQRLYIVDLDAHLTEAGGPRYSIETQISFPDRVATAVIELAQPAGTSAGADEGGTSRSDSADERVRLIVIGPREDV